MTWLWAILAAYLLGSIPFGLLLGRLHGIDIREHGSKNIGATNVNRVLGRPWGWLCFGLDVLKGAVPVLGVGALTGVLATPVMELDPTEMWLWMAVAVAATLGHVYPISIGFKGGKGVATAFGALAAMWPLLTVPAFAALLVWYAVLRVTRYVSVASIAAAVALPLCYVLWVIGTEIDEAGQRLAHAAPPLIVVSVLSGLVIYLHRSNIARLRQGIEPKIGEPARKG